MKKLIMSARGAVPAGRQGSAFGGKKTILFFLTLLALILISGCNGPKPIANNTQEAKKETKISFLVPTQDPLKYCNGADMDSEGFRKTITNEVTRTIFETNLTEDQLANKTLELAAQEAKMNFPQSTTDPTGYMKVLGDTSYIQPTDGWAGVSIFMCAWKPFVEANLLKLSNIKNVVWVNDWNQWNNLK
ncbi:MAG: hypothetical protein NTX00_00215 [Candidatus Parcubacteria bacterium]|nr:hypothetical protein [Candidatus Parcubacteria bacterium]